jgi:hypothetical protein
MPAAAAAAAADDDDDDNDKHTGLGCGSYGEHGRAVV